MWTISYRSSVWKVRYSVCAFIVAIRLPSSLQMVPKTKNNMFPSSMPKESSQRMHQLRRLKRPTVEMKKTLHRFASVLCLLTLLLNAATCLHAERPRQSSCSHCPTRAPHSHTLPSCCTAQHQPPAVASAEANQPVLSIAVLTPLLSTEVAPFRSSPVKRLTASPPPPPRITLRI